MAHAVRAELAGHPANPARLAQRIDVTLTGTSAGGLTLGYAIRGPTRTLRIPTLHTPSSADALWRHTCCELFVSAANHTPYREFNFSPSGQSAVYDFLDYRQRATADPRCTPPEIRVIQTEALLQLDVMLAEDALPPADALRIALAVVLEADDGSLGFWALAHPAGKPDFHHRAGFTLNHTPAGFRP
ncbi:MAG: DOMON-like domain-containing protein [Rhodocyclaceae bacterium]|jgi:hypothetical protein|nr:DOMON-like domain-containing protein [Rhodocyclaceae bacterium]